MSERLKYAQQRLPKLKCKNVLWIDGGSYPTKAVFSNVLKQELSKLGYDVDVVHMAMGAANHFERGAMYRRLAPYFDAHRKGRKKQRWVYLAEVQRQYDLEPMAQFLNNLETARTYSYLTPRVVWDVLWTMGSADVREPEHPWRQRLDILRHGLVFAFNAGITSRYTSLRKVRARPGDGPRTNLKKFDYRGLSGVIAAAKNPQPSPVPRWLFDIRERGELEVWGKYIKKWVYFAVPSTRPNSMEHAISFCKATKRPCFAPRDTQLLERLDARRNWNDGGHVSIPGGQIYSKWLAQQLHHSGVLAH